MHSPNEENRVDRSRFVVLLVAALVVVVIVAETADLQTQLPVAVQEDGPVCGFVEDELELIAL